MKAYGVVAKGNGEAWLMEELHTSLTIGGGQAGQGYPCVLIDEDIQSDKPKRDIQGERDQREPNCVRRHIRGR